LDVDLKGVILCGQIAARQMVRQGSGGRIINISSVHAVFSIRTAAVYDAAKAGVQRLTGTMALELAEHGITVNAIAQGWMDTSLAAPLLDTPEKLAEVNASIPAGRVGNPHEVG
jgi:glucose 1-dehydrogenase